MSRVASVVTEAAFASRRRADWEELEALTGKVARRGLRRLDQDEIVRFSPLYRDLCADLACAQAARYSAPLVEYLHGLTASTHAAFYGAAAIDTTRGSFERAHSLLVAFPRAVRRRWRSVLLSFALFFVPFALGVIASLRDPSFAFRIVPEAMLKPLTEAYAHGFSDGRAASDSTVMAGFYVYNNVGIALRVFALGVFGGLGSAFYLVQNGLSIGAILGYVASQGAGANIVTFIVGHGSLELGAVVLAGAAGLSMGWSVVAPGDRARVASLQSVARDVVPIVFGAAVMLLMAAGIEGFWSGSSVSSTVKHVVGITLFSCVIAYLVLAGRARRGEVV